MTETTWATARLAEELGRDLVAADDVAAAMQLVADRAPVVTGLDAASVTVIDKGRFRTAVTTAAWAAEADALQYDLDEGPCVAAAVDQAHYVVADARHDSRFPTWGPQAADLGVGSVLAVRVVMSSKTVGALNLFSRDPRDHTADDLATAYLLAGQVGTAIASALRVEHLRTALDSRGLVGTAQGMVMQRYGLDEQRAWQLLVRLSQHSNVKVRDLAATLVETGTLPGLDEHQADVPA